MANSLTFNQIGFSASKQCLIDSDGAEIRLRAQSLLVFKILAAKPNELISKSDLIESVWPDVHVTDDSLTKCIADIRKALSDTDHTVLKTIRRQGYMLVSDDVDTGNRNDTQNTSTAIWHKRLNRPAALALFVLVAASWFLLKGNPDVANTRSTSSTIPGTPTLNLYAEPNIDEASTLSNKLLPELKASLSRYRTLEIKGTDFEYQLLLAQTDDAKHLNVELIRDSDSALFFAESFPVVAQSQKAIRDLANRIAGAIASPGVGFLDRQLLKDSRLKPIEELSEAECFANGFGCAKCSGEEDNITKRAEACLAQILQKDDQNARAWALQATIYAHQYWWGNTLPEPLRSNLHLRKQIPAKAIRAANKAESLSSGDDSAIYWGMAEAYFASCQADKLSAVVQRGLEINPNDPNLLASFGNWLSYAGRWDEGAALTQRALDLEPKYYRKWWWMGIAKTHYFKEEYQQAYNAFLKSFNDRNWISHLQFAYTLPHLGRLDEARESVAQLRRLLPGATVEKALEFYDILCFPDSFLENMRTALVMAGLPSRGSSDVFSDIVLPRAKTLQIDDYVAEYLDHGDGEPILFVHGSLSDYRSWGYYMVPIFERHRFISFSRRYHGTQDWADKGEQYNLAQHTQDLIDFIESMKLDSVHAVSWSVGFGPLHYATIARPDLFKSVVHYEPVDPSLFDGQDVDGDLLESWDKQWDEVSALRKRGDLELAAERFIEIVFESKEHGGYANERESLKEIFRQNSRTLPVESADKGRFPTDCDAANNTTIPTLVVAGSETHYFYKKQAELFTHCADVASMVTIEGVNHRGPLDAVQELSDLIIGFADLHSR